MATTGSNLARILGASGFLLHARRRAALTALLADDVVWTGLLPELVCHGRDEVVSLMTRRSTGARRVRRFDAEEIGDSVVVSVEGPDFDDNGVLPATAPRHLVFTFEAERVVRIASCVDRESAVAHAASLQHARSE